MKKNIVLALIIVFTFIACNNELRFEKIEKASSEFYNHSYDSLKTRIDAYIVYGYKNDAKTERLIDSFACQLAKPLYKKYLSYDIEFYKKSHKTNIDYINKHHKHWNAYALFHDYLWHYSFNQHGFASKAKVKNSEGRKFFYPRPECLSKKKQKDSLR